MLPYNSMNVAPCFNSCLAAAHPAPTFSQTENVVGEGDVATILFQDGSIRFFFIPYGNPSQIQPFNPYTPAYRHPYWFTSSGIWFVRSVSNPIPIFSFNQLLQEMYASSRLEQSRFWDNNPNKPFKFHNNADSSTSDLRRFCCVKCSCVGESQRVQPAPAPPTFIIQQTPPCTTVATAPTPIIKCNESVQVHVEPMATSDHGIGRKSSRFLKKQPKKRDTSTTPCTDFLKVPVTSSRGKLKKKCQCSKAATTDKSSTTYNTQPTNCMQLENTKTQTSAEQGVSVYTETKPHKAEIWTAVTPRFISISGSSAQYRTDNAEHTGRSPDKSLSKLISEIPKIYSFTKKESLISTHNKSRNVAFGQRNYKENSNETDQNKSSEPSEVWIKKGSKSDFLDTSELWTCKSNEQEMETDSSTCILSLCDSDSTNCSKTSIQ